MGDIWTARGRWETYGQLIGRAGRHGDCLWVDLGDIGTVMG